MPISINNTTLTFNNGTTMTTAATGTVSSVATGNGLSGGTITTSGTLTIACPSYQSVGSYSYTAATAFYQYQPGSNYSGLPVGRFENDSSDHVIFSNGGTLPGTWKIMNGVGFGGGSYWGGAIVCRVA